MYVLDVGLVALLAQHALRCRPERHATHARTRVKRRPLHRLGRLVYNVLRGHVQLESTRDLSEDLPEDRVAVGKACVRT